VCLFPVFAAATGTYGNLVYFDNGKTVTITGYTGDPTTVTIPESINGRVVSSIGRSAFAGCIRLAEVNIPNSIISIGESAFARCYSLNEVNIPDSVTSIGEWAFDSCIGLTVIIIPDSVTSIGDYAFYTCSSLINVYIPGSVETIGYSVFHYCDSLASINVAADNPGYASVDGVLYNKSVTILIKYPTSREGGYTVPDGVASINDVAFYGSTGLTSVALPNSLTSISRGTFNGCSSLAEVNIPNSVTSIGESAFARCYSLTGIIIPDSVTSIGESAFNGCRNLTVVNIPDSVTSISKFAFANSGLINVYIPGSVATIGDRAFSYCDSLASINVASDNPGYASVDGVLYNKSVTILIQYPTSRKGGYTVPDGVTLVNDFAFCQSSGLTGVTFPKSLTSIGHSAFFRCSSLSQIVIPKNVTIIGTRAFQKCGGLYDVYFESATPPHASDYTFMEVRPGARALVPIDSTGYGQSGSLWCRLIVTLSASPPPPQQSVHIPTVILNGKELDFDVYPRIQNGRVLVPLRTIFEAVGATVDWNNGTKTAVAYKDGVTVSLTLGNTIATINDNPVTLDQPAISVNGRTLAPLRFVGEAFGGIVNWDASSRTVYITAVLPELDNIDTNKGVGSNE